MTEYLKELNKLYQLYQSDYSGISFPYFYFDFGKDRRNVFYNYNLVILYR